MSGTVTAQFSGGPGTFHELKAGVELEGSRSRFEIGAPGGRQYLDVSGVPLFGVLWPTGADTSTIRRTSLYLHDRWRVSDRITVSPGLRLDAHRGSVPDAGRVFATTPLSPRVGLAWDVSSDHRTVVRAHVGRYHDPAFGLPVSYVDRSEPLLIGFGDVGPSGEIIVGEPPTPFRSRIDPDIRHSGMNQIVFGVEREVIGGMSVQLHYVHRNFEAAIAFDPGAACW